MNIRTPREIAVSVLVARSRASEYVEDLLAKELTGQNLAPADRALAQELAYGIVRWEATLDWLIGLKAQARPQKVTLQILLRLGLYQIFWLERIPDHAAVHQTVELAKQLGFGSQSGFINAVLRGYLREREQTERLLDELKIKQPALAYSHPEWLFLRWQQRWGLDKTVQLMTWNNQPPKTFARVNALRASAESLLEAWKIEGVESEPWPVDWAPGQQVFQLVAHPRLADMASFQKGSFYVQDPSTLLAVRALDPQPEETVLDMCAAPGGKTTYIAELMQNRGQILARDLHPERLEMVRENCVRLGVTNVQTALAPETLPSPFSPRFDRVLIDAPCSNTGVLRRRVDLRWRIRPEEFQRLQASQLRLMDNASAELKPGGSLVYSTCSLEPEENRGVVEQFLNGHPGWKVLSERELLPFVDRVDGAYVACLTA